MNKDNKNTELNDTDKKLHISDVSVSKIGLRTKVKLIVNGKSKFPPTDIEDKNEPSLWKPEHWNWFLSYYH